MAERVLKGHRMDEFWQKPMLRTEIKLGVSTDSSIHSSLRLFLETAASPRASDLPVVNIDSSLISS